MDKFVKDKVRVTIERLEELSTRSIEEIQQLKYIPCGYKSDNQVPKVDAEWNEFGRSDRVSGRDEHFWFYTEINTPVVSDDEQLYLEITTGHEGEWDAENPQGIVYLNGEIAHGVDVNHRKVVLTPNTAYKIHLYFYVGMITCDTEVKLNLKVRDNRINALYYDLKVPYDAALCFEENQYAYTHVRILKHLDVACNLLDFTAVGSKEFYESVESAEQYLKEEFFEKECGNSDAVVSYVGHTHIDVAWLWTYAQTKEKTQRSFSTVLDLMDRYPEYIFMSSQPQLYEYLKEEAPILYERVKQRVAEGRWEVEGAMWLEADCNLSSGESLVRQILYGKKFIMDEFGVESKILWLPDVFGYSAALPQILKKSGVNQFVTSKISWNEFNKMPYDTFMWQGIDGTEIFTYFLTAQDRRVRQVGGDYMTTYVGKVDPDMNLGTWERYQQKEYNTETIVTFGWGDGGGGPTEEMLEVERRLEYGLPGMPKAQMSRAGDFLKRVEENFHKNCQLLRRTPKWVGELYLELHRGTYTSIGKNKKNNRECEFLCQDTEMLSVTDKLLMKGSYPTDTLRKAWKTILLNQFHDVIPGSSIEEVYNDTDVQYAELRKEVGECRDEKLDNLSKQMSQSGVMVYNPNSFVASDYVKNGDDILFVEDVPALGWKVVDRSVVVGDVLVTEYGIESEHYRISFDEHYLLLSVFDKDCQREILAPAQKGNILRAFEDTPRAYDNWEITNYYKAKFVDVEDVTSVKQINGVGYGGFEITRTYHNSTIKQSMIVYSNSRRIDFVNDVDWHEQHTLLKVVFPVDILANKATYDIQFGNVERPTHENTSWEAAKFEVCAHKWCDLSEDDYGVSILNDCKYGHSIFENQMMLTLIKCGTYPNPVADQGRHTFTYAFYPHAGNYKQGGTIQEAYLLNRPMTAKKTNGGGILPDTYSLISCDCKNIIMETVKEAEDGKGIVVRLHDTWNKKSNPTLRFGFEVKKISLCDMMERPIREISQNNLVTLPVGNFEIVTLLIEV